MKQKEPREFKKVFLQLSTEDIRALALAMQEQEDNAALAAYDEIDPIDEDMKLNQELVDSYAAGAITQAIEPDPSCLTEDELWQRMMAPQVKATPRRSSRRPSYKGWLVLALAAAGLLLLVNPWPELKNGPLRWHKGPQPSDDLIHREDCQLALRSAGGIIELDVEGLKLPPSSPVFLIARCQRDGFLQILLKDGNDTLSFVNVAVARSEQWQELSDANLKPLGFRLPAQGRLKLEFGLSDHVLTATEFGQLGSPTSKIQPNETWRWMQQRQWTIDQRLSP